MLNIEEILKMSEDMGVEIVDGTSGKHYILDDSGKKIEFNTEMIIGKRIETISYEVELEALSFGLDNSNKMYDMSSSANLYKYKPGTVKNSITVLTNFLYFRDLDGIILELLEPID